MVAADLGSSTAAAMHGAASAEVLALATSPVDPIFVSSTALSGAHPTWKSNVCCRCHLDVPCLVAVLLQSMAQCHIIHALSSASLSQLAQARRCRAQWRSGPLRNSIHQ